MHSVQAGSTDKALSYADKALQFIQQQKGECVGAASNPGLPHPYFISQPWRKKSIFLTGCEIKEGLG